jgi:hypothetical protein
MQIPELQELDPRLSAATMLEISERSRKEIQDSEKREADEIVKSILSHCKTSALQGKTWAAITGPLFFKMTQGTGARNTLVISALEQLGYSLSAVQRESVEVRWKPVK